MQRKTQKYFKFILVSLIILLSSTTLYLGLVVGGVLKFNGGKFITREEYSKYEKNVGRYEKLEAIEDYVKKVYYKDTSKVDFEEGIIDGLFSALNDPYSVYFNPKEFKSFMELNKGSYGGLGIAISPSKEGNITVLSTFEDTPASKADIKPDDEIIKVNGTRYKAKDIDIAIGKMKGKPGTDVTITILRKGKTFDVKLTRANIVLKSVKSRILDKKDKIGYLQITSFDNKVYKEFTQNLNGLLDKDVKGLVIDLRNNPGGSLSEVVKVADRILGEQVIVSTKDRAGNKEVMKSDAKKLNIPYVVLVNGYSASASEILTGAIKDSKSGKIIGTKTYGKGLVQSVLPLTYYGGGIKVTIAQYFTPNGSYINEKGIEPDIKVELSKDFKVTDEKTDNQLSKAVEVLKSEVK